MQINAKPRFREPPLGFEFIRETIGSEIRSSMFRPTVRPTGLGTIVALPISCLHITDNIAGLSEIIKHWN